MARHHLRRKLKTYHSLYRINQAFAAISRHVWLLEQAGFMPIVKMKVFRGLVRELQSMISHDVTDRMHHLEDRDCFRFGQVRIGWEHHLNGPAICLIKWWPGACRSSQRFAIMNRRLHKVTETLQRQAKRARWRLMSGGLI